VAASYHHPYSYSLKVTAADGFVVDVDFDVDIAGSAVDADAGFDSDVVVAAAVGADDPTSH